MAALAAHDWIDRCAARLREQWRSVEAARLDDLAVELWSDRRWNVLPPETAAVEWLKQGVLASAID